MAPPPTRTLGALSRVSSCLPAVLPVHSTIAACRRLQRHSQSPSFRANTTRRPAALLEQRVFPYRAESPRAQGLIHLSAPSHHVVRSEPRLAQVPELRANARQRIGRQLR